VTDIAAAQAEQGGEVSGGRPYLSPSERDEALAQYQREENARQDRERMAQAAAADPRSRPTASPVPALRGPDGEYRGEERGLGPQPAFTPPVRRSPIPPNPFGEVVSEEVEEEITEDTPQNEEQIREVATMIAESKTNEEGEEEFDINSARRRAYVTSGILDIVNGLILAIAGAQGTGVNRQAMASALASSDAPLEAFREMAQAARQRREAEDQRRRLKVQDARQAALDERQTRAAERQERVLEMREGEYRAEEGERARLAQLRDPESEGSATARAQYVTQLVDMGVPREVAESRVQGQSGADIAARADEIAALRAARAQYFTPRRGVRRPSERGWQRQLRGLGYGGGRGSVARPSSSSSNRRGRVETPTTPASPGAPPADGSVTVEEDSETVQIDVPDAWASPPQADEGEGEADAPSPAQLADQEWQRRADAASDPDSPGGEITTTSEARAIAIAQRRAQDLRRQEVEAARDARQAQTDQRTRRTQDNTAAQRLNDDLASANIPDFERNLSEMRRVLNDSLGTQGLGLHQILARIEETGEDLPGSGASAMVPNPLLSSRGQDVRRIISDLVDLRGRERSGAAISQDEERRFREQIGALEGVTSDRQLLRGLISLRDLVGQSRNRIQAAHPTAMEYLTTDQGEFMVYPAPGVDAEPRRMRLTGREIGRLRNRGLRVERAD